MDYTLQKQLTDRILFMLMSRGADVDGLKERLQMILRDYRIEPKENAIVEYSEQKNEIFLQRFLMAKAVAGLTPRTLEAYRGVISKLLREIGKDADGIQPQDVTILFARQLRDGITKSYIDTERRYLNSFYSWLVREELVAKNPIIKLDKIKYAREPQKAFSEIEIERIRSACRDSREAAIVEMLMSTGCRCAELISIKISDIRSGKVNICGKGQKYRDVYLNARAQIAVEKYLSERSDGNPYLFPRVVPFLRQKQGKSHRLWTCAENIEQDGALGTSTVEDIIRKLGRRAGVEDCHPHKFRRTCATFALQRGMPLVHVSKMLGHANVTTTQIYLDIADSEVETAHKKYVV